MRSIPGATFGALCNGSTADFGSVYPGSNPGAPAWLVVWMIVHDEEAGSYSFQIGWLNYLRRVSACLIFGLALVVFI
jgi:hypothetical protein